MGQLSEQFCDFRIAAAFHRVGQMSEAVRCLALQLDRVGQKFFNGLQRTSPLERGRSRRQLRQAADTVSGYSAAVGSSAMSAVEMSHSSRVIEASMIFRCSLSSRAKALARSRTSAFSEVSAIAR